MVPVPEIAPPAPVVTILADVRFPVTDTAVPNRLAAVVTLPAALAYPPVNKLLPITLPLKLPITPNTLPVALTNPATVNPLVL